MLPPFLELLIESKEPFLVLEGKIYTLSTKPKNDYFRYNNLKLGIEQAESLKELENEFLENSLTRTKFINYLQKNSTILKNGHYQKIDSLLKSQFSVELFFKEKVFPSYFNLKNKTSLKGSDFVIPQASIDLTDRVLSTLEEVLLSSESNTEKGLLFYPNSIYALNEAKTSNIHIKFKEKNLVPKKKYSYADFKNKYVNSLGHLLFGKNITVQIANPKPTLPLIEKNLSLTKENNQYRFNSKTTSYIINDRFAYYKFPPANLHMKISFKDNFLSFTTAKTQGNYKHPLVSNSGKGNLCHGDKINYYWNEFNVVIKPYSINELISKDVARQISQVMIVAEDLLKTGLHKTAYVYHPLHIDTFKEYKISESQAKNSGLNIYKVI